MNKNSLFAVLLRSPWWISIAVAAGLYALANSIYVAAGEITDNARAFAAMNNIRLLHDAELAKLLPMPPAARTRV